MAEDSIVTEYRIKTDKLAGDVSALVAQYAKAEKAGTESAARVTDKYTEQAKILENLRAQIEKLTAVRDKETDPAKLAKINAQLTEMTGGYDKLRAAIETSNVPLNKQAGLIENMRKRVETLTDARERESDPKRIERYNKLLSDQHARISRITASTSQQSGILQVMANRIEQLSNARMRADSPERIERINKLLREQQTRYDALTGTQTKVGTSTNLLSSQFATLGASIVGAFAVDRILAFASQTVDAYAKAEAQTEKLRFSVERLSGGQSDGAFDRLVEQSKALKEGTFFDDEDIQQAQAMLTQFGLTADQVERLTPGILDAAIALDTDLAGAANAAITAFTGTTRGLKKVNGDFKDTGTVVGNYNEVLRVFSGLQGSAASALDTVSGQMRKQKVEAEDLQEQIGERLAPALLNLKRVALEVANDFVGLFFPESAKEKFKKNVDALTGILQSDTKSTVASLTSELNSVVAETANKKAEFERLQAELNKKLVTTPGDSNRLVAVKKEYMALVEQQRALKIAIEQKSVAETAANADAIKNAEREKLMHDDISKLNSKELEARLKALKARNDANNSFVTSAIQLTQTQLDKVKQLEERAAEKNKSDREQAFQQLLAMNDKFNEQRLQSFAKSELDALEITRRVETERARILFEKSGGNNNPAAVAAFNKVVENINAFTDEKIADNKIKKAIEVQNQLRAISEQTLKGELDLTLQNIDNSTAIQIQAAREAHNKKGDFTAAAEERLQDEINRIQANGQRARINEQIRTLDEQTARTINKIKQDAANIIAIETDAFNKRGDTSIEATQRLNDRIFEINADAQRETTAVAQNASQEKEKLEGALTAVSINENDKRVERESLAAQQIIAIRQQVVQQSLDLLTQIAAVDQAVHDGRVQNLEFEKEQLGKAFEDEQDALQARFDNRLITEKQFETQSDAIKKKRVEAEKKVQAQINAEKRKADLIERARSLFQIGISSRQAYAAALAQPPGPPVTIPSALLALGLGLAQAAAVLATPLPKYEYGTPWLKRRNGEPMGRDTIVIRADEGERIVPRVQNVRHWKWYNALEDGTFNKKVHETFVLPALLKSHQEQRKRKIETQSTGIARAMLMQTGVDADGFDWYEFGRMWKKGIRISNLDEITPARAPVKSIYIN